MATRISERKRVAYHEAGHAVAAFITTRELQFSTIIPDPDDDGNLGRTVHNDPEWWDHPTCPENEFAEARTRKERTESRITICLAGRAADEKLRGVVH
jgi:ATP-dependent Zn protease